MQVSCSAPLETCSYTLADKIEKLGITPIVTNVLIRAVYEGDNREIGEAIVNLFAEEHDHDITVYYSPEEQSKSARRAMRKLAKQERRRRQMGLT